MTDRAPAITILTSGVGLGVYIPALLLHTQFSTLGRSSDVEVLEGYYTPEHRTAHLAHKEAFRANFALAQISNRMTRDVQNCFDGDRIEALLQCWKEEGRNRFIVWSGFWLPVIERYRSTDLQLHVDHCRIDAEISASFRIYPHLAAAGREIWLWNWKERRIVHEIPVSANAPLCFRERENQLVVHGGGWGLGSYRDAVDELQQTSYSVASDRCFLPDPNWQPWTRDADGNHEFPPVGEVIDSHNIVWHRSSKFHPFYDVIRRSKAIVSKPGGCTLIDSLASATPVLFLDAYSAAERSNGSLWEYLGFGMPYSAWRETGYDPKVLETLHLNIMSRTARGVDYAQTYAAQVVQEATA